MVRAAMSVLSKLPSALLFLLAFAGCKAAPETAPAPAAPSAVAGGESTEAPAAKRPLLYVVRGEGSPSYLFGTIHAGVSAERVLGEGGLATVARSRVLLTELSAEIDPAVLLGAMLLPKDSSLQSIVGEERFRVLTARITEAPPAFVDRLAPWAAMLQAGAEDMKRLAKAREGDFAAAMDLELQNLAKKHGVTNVGLEGVEDQIAVFVGIAPDLLLELLDDAASEKGQASLEKLYDAYLAGDADAILALTEEDIEDAPELYERLLPARNKAWMKTLTAELTKGAAFVAVGAAHLYGDEGLIALLREAGFTVERATPSDY
jgi:uncharacterized protein